MGSEIQIMGNFTKIKGDPPGACCLIAMSESNKGDEGDTVECQCGCHWEIKGGEWEKVS